jgi:hypothetical protein
MWRGDGLRICEYRREKYIAWEQRGGESSMVVAFGVSDVRFVLVISWC